MFGFYEFNRLCSVYSVCGFLVHQSRTFFVLWYFDCCIDCIVFLGLSVCLSLHIVVWIKIITTEWHNAQKVQQRTAADLVSRTCWTCEPWVCRGTSRAGCGDLWLCRRGHGYGNACQWTVPSWTLAFHRLVQKYSLCTDMCSDASIYQAGLLHWTMSYTYNKLN